MAWRGDGILAGRNRVSLATLALFAGVIWAVDRTLASSAPVPVAVVSGGNQAAPARNLVVPPGPAMSWRLAACCEIVMGLTMSYILITML